MPLNRRIFLLRPGWLARRIAARAASRRACKVIVQGDASPNTLRLIAVVQAQRKALGLP